MKDKKATILNFHQAQRFVTAMQSFDSANLLSSLDDKRHEGSRRIHCVLAFIGS